MGWDLSCRRKYTSLPDVEKTILIMMRINEKSESSQNVVSPGYTQNLSLFCYQVINRLASIYNTYTYRMR